MLTGTIINALAIIAGSLAGLLLRRLTAHTGKKAAGAETASLGSRLQNTVTSGMGLCTLYIGVSGALKGQNTLVAIFSMALGALIGELLDLDRAIHRLGDWVQRKLTPNPTPGAPSVAEGFVTASLLFCVGAMAIVGSLENGLTGNCDTLKAKAVLDGVSSIVFATSMGLGVILSAAAVFVYQGAISLAAGLLSPLLSDAVVADMTCVGSLLIVAISLNLLKVGNIKVANYLPAVFLPILLCRFFT